ncbi:FAD-dependent monooxygenase [Flexivirga meconopsidis]|uniref:FAD-dependent monooxygenase n=1 Tax=Flexivirga meconopsidis TaxID=2977121 RepID=UPI0022409413|nr:FAD-dependent monooxygenase [Flexivirga meconopsidis]
MSTAPDPGASPLGVIGGLEETDVLIAGAGPVGLTLALELELHGITTLLAERNTRTTRHPKMDVTNGRSMELYRRLGVADELRKVAVPTDHRIKVTWATGAEGWELASFEYPSVDEARAAASAANDGRGTLEPSMRVSQIILEPALRDIVVARAQHVTVDYGWMVEEFRQDDRGVTATLLCEETGHRRLVRAKYLIGCDGGGSRTRRQLGIDLDEISLRRQMIKKLGLGRTLRGAVRAYRALGHRPPDGRFYMVHFSTTDRRMVERFGQVWHLQSPEGWTLISQDDGDTWTLHTPLSARDNIDAIDPAAFVCEQLGMDFDMEIHVANAWTPRLVVSKSFGRGRVWLAGDAVHQVPPTGGYGMNTGVGDAIGLGWAIAAQLQGWGGPRLLEAYQRERQAIAYRNRESAARNSAVRGAIMAAFDPVMHSEDWSGDVTRKQLGRYILDLGNLENEAHGIEHGYRYDGSPVICAEAGSAPRLRTDEYLPGTWPGSRPPSVRLNDGTQIFDLFGRGFTLLRFSETDITDLAGAAHARGVPLTVVDVRDDHARDLYQRDLVLIRPDQHVAWRGQLAPTDPLSVIDRVRGA